MGKVLLGVSFRWTQLRETRVMARMLGIMEAELAGHRAQFSFTSFTAAVDGICYTDHLWLTTEIQCPFRAIFPSPKGVFLPTQNNPFHPGFSLCDICSPAAPGEVSAAVFQVRNTALQLEYVLTGEL